MLPQTQSIIDLPISERQIVEVSSDKKSAGCSCVAGLPLLSFAMFRCLVNKEAIYERRRGAAY